MIDGIAVSESYSGARSCLGVPANKSNKVKNALLGRSSASHDPLYLS